MEGEERKTEEQVKKPQSRKPKIAFGPTEVEKKKTIAYKKMRGWFCNQN
jgi:hypothetical protein